MDNSPVIHRPNRRLDDIDMFRGWCVLWMLAVHIAITMPPSVYGVIAMYDCVAEGFVFLAGVMIGYHYLPKFKTDPIHTTRRLWMRALQILALHYGMALYVRLHLTFVRGESYGAGVWQFLWDTLSWRYQDFLADILPMFVLFMALAPLGMWLLVRGLWPILAAASIGMFAWGQWHPWDISVRHQAAFPAILWQLYFIAGGVWGIMRRNNVSITNPQRPWRALGITWLVWLLMLMVPWIIFYASGHWMLTGIMWPNKWPLNVGRVLFLAPLMLFLYYFFMGLARREKPLPGAQTLVLVGQHSLFGFTLHALLVYWWNEAALANIIPMVLRPLLMVVLMVLLAWAVRLCYGSRLKKSAPASAR